MTGDPQHDPYAARPWLASYPPGVPHEIDPSEYSTLVDMFRKSVEAFTDRPAMESFGARLTFRELSQAADRVAAWLQAQGLQKGDRVAIMSPNVLAYPAILFGALIAGGVVVNVNPLYTPSELAHQINDSGARYLFVFENFAFTAEAAWSEMTIERAIIVTAGDLMGLKGLIVNFVAAPCEEDGPGLSFAGRRAFLAGAESGFEKAGARPGRARRHRLSAIYGRHDRRRQGRRSASQKCRRGCRTILGLAEMVSRAARPALHGDGAAALSHFRAHRLLHADHPHRRLLPAHRQSARSQRPYRDRSAIRVSRCSRASIRSTPRSPSIAISARSISRIWS